MMRWRLATILLVNLKLCGVEIASNKLRSFISSLGIFLGTAALLVNMSFMRGMQDNVVREMGRMGGVSLLTVRAKSPRTPEERLAFSRSQGLYIDEGVRIAARVPGVKRIVLQKDLSWRRIRGGGRGTHAPIKAINAGHYELFDYALAQGRFFSSEALAGRERECIVGERTIERLFRDQQGCLLGRTIVVEGIPCRIVGVIESKNRWDSRARECHIPYNLYMHHVGGSRNRVSEFLLEVEDVNDIEQVQVAVTRALRDMHRGVEDFEIEANRDKIQDMRQTSAAIWIVAAAVAFISLAVGGINIMNTMFGTIGDRIREIGLRKALGARRADLFLQFLLEAVVLSVVGGLPGMMLGTAVTLFPEGSFPYVPRLSYTDFLLCVLFIGSAGLISGLFPAWHASRMEPVEALRY